MEFKDVPKSKMHSETPTAQLRYRKDGRLQQAWLIVTYDGGVVDSKRTEWRDVPTVQDE